MIASTKGGSGMALPTGVDFIIGALHLPPFPGTQQGRSWSLPAIEEFAIANARAFADGGFPALYIQEATAGGPAMTSSPQTVAYMTRFGRAVRAVFPGLLGVLVSAPDAEAPIAIAHAIDAQFVRLKVYVGAMIKAEGIVQGSAREAIQARERIGASEVALIADVYDRTGAPLGDASIEEAATWAVKFGSADALVLTGQRFEDSLRFVERVRGQDLDVPLLIGGSITSSNVAVAISAADGVIVSTWLKKASNEPQDHIVWDIARMKELMATAQTAKKASPAVTSER
jgi:membrane complex biogenesis BtpA family protein